MLLVCQDLNTTHTMYVCMVGEQKMAWVENGGVLIIRDNVPACETSRSCCVNQGIYQPITSLTTIQLLSTSSS